MQTYRAYLIDPDGRIRHGAWIEAADEVEANRKAREMAQGGKVELWFGPVRLAVIEGDRPASRRG